MLVFVHFGMLVTVEIVKRDAKVEVCVVRSEGDIKRETYESEITEKGTKQTVRL